METTKLAMKRIAIARGIAGREPEGASDTFDAKTDKVYAFVEVEKPQRLRGEIAVEFQPPSKKYEGAITLGVGESSRFRTWAFTRQAHEARRVDRHRPRRARPRARARKVRRHGGTHAVRIASARPRSGVARRRSGDPMPRRACESQRRFDHHFVQEVGDALPRVRRRDLRANRLEEDPSEQTELGQKRA